MSGKSLRINQITVADAPPEKAGVGGSSPSLATTRASLALLYQELRPPPLLDPS